MENKKIKFPVAIIFIVCECLSCLLYALYLCNQKYYSSNSNELLKLLIPLCLDCASKLLFCCLLFRRKSDDALLLAICILIIPSLYFSTQNTLPVKYLLINIVGLIATILTILIVGTITLPKLSLYKNLAKKILFIPSILFAVEPLSQLPLYLGNHLFVTSPYNFLYYVIGPMLGAIGIYLFLRWASNPYSKKTINKHVNIHEGE